MLHCWLELLVDVVVLVVLVGMCVVDDLRDVKGGVVLLLAVVRKKGPAANEDGWVMAIDVEELVAVLVAVLFVEAVVGVLLLEVVFKVVGINIPLVIVESVVMVLVVPVAILVVKAVVGVLLLRVDFDVASIGTLLVGVESFVAVVVVVPGCVAEDTSVGRLGRFLFAAPAV